MLCRIVSPAIIALVLSLLGSTDAAAVLAQRTFVASYGNDANACSIGAPCRGFAAALAQTATNGEVIVLDSAGYGPATITQAVSIEAPTGIYAGISVFSGDGLAINAPGAKVILRGLTINSQGGFNGINFLAGAGLHVENCVVSGFSGHGIIVSAAGVVLHIIDTIVRENSSGIVINGTTSITTATISRTRVEHNTQEGIEVTAGADVTIEDCVVTGSAYNIDAYTLVATAFIGMTVTRTVVHGGIYGIIVEPLAINTLVQVAVSDSTVSGMSQIGIGAAPGGAASAVVTVARTHVLSNNFALKADSTNGGAWILMDANTIEYNQQGAVAVGPTSTLWTRANNTAKVNTFSDYSGTLTFVPAM
jgi:hypothetical protein